MILLLIILCFAITCFWCSDWWRWCHY